VAADVRLPQWSSFERVLMRGAILVFLVTYLLNVAPAFAPPTWMVFSFIGLRSAASNAVLLAMVGAVAATLGRVTLAKFSHLVIRRRFLSQSARENVDVIRTHLEGKRGLSFGIALFYAFTPFPSNYLFIAYGLTGMSLLLIAVPFFLGRCISYTFLVFTSSAVLGRVLPEAKSAVAYFSVYFIVVQLLLLYLVYVFTKVDWKFFFAYRKFRWLAAARPIRP
jgi:hypothetical protein